MKYKIRKNQLEIHTFLYINEPDQAKTLESCFFLKRFKPFIVGKFHKPMQ